MIYFDFSKAFDRVPLHRLIDKLSHYGLNKNIILWIENLLKNRSQSVRHKGILSSPKPIPSGIVQGIIISAVLYVSNINDIVTVVRNAKVSIFVDDLKLSHKINYIRDNHLLQEDINAITQWSLDWKLPLNPEKLAHVHIGHRHPSFQYISDIDQIYTVGKYVDLGIAIDSSLSFRDHIANIVRKAHETCYQIFSAFQSRNLEFVATVFTGYVYTSNS